MKEAKRVFDNSDALKFERATGLGDIQRRLGELERHLSPNAKLELADEISKIEQELLRQGKLKALIINHVLDKHMR